MTKFFISSILALLVSLPCYGWQTVLGQVTELEATYLPTTIMFKMSTGSSVCPAGAWLKWANSNTENNKAVYATLLTAAVSGTSILFYIADGDTTCTGAFIHVAP